MSRIDEFIKGASLQGMKPEALPLAKSMFGLITDMRNQTVDECAELVTKWAEITQMAERPDVKMLLGTIQGMKEDIE